MLAAIAGPAFAEPIELQWWHAMTAINLERVNKLAADFNALQTDYKVTPVYKGSYPETMTAAIAAFRAGNPPHIVQVFEVGTATMMAAKGAVKPVYQLMADAGEPFDPQTYLPAVTGYYSTADGKMLSIAVQQLDRDRLLEQGRLSRRPGSTRTSRRRPGPRPSPSAKKLKAGGANCAVVPAWISWTQIEQFNRLAQSAIGNEGERARRRRIPSLSSTRPRW